MIETFEIQNYRLFKHLKIEKLGRVNLITGKNNVGKTALLEALFLFSSKYYGDALKNIQIYRDYLTSFTKTISIKTIFRDFNLSNGIEIGTGESDIENKLKISNVKYIDEWNQNRTFFKRQVVKESPYSQQGVEFLYQDVQQIIPLNSEEQSRYHSQLFSQKQEINLFSFLPSSGIRSEASIEIWDSIVLTPMEKEVIERLRIIIPDIQDIAVVQHPELKDQRRFEIKIINSDKRIPLSEMGEGTGRFLLIILELVFLKNGTFLIDEIENGIHYSIHQKLWEILLDLADKFNVQVFATTHSWDCIDGFQRALNAFHDPSQGQLLRLSMRNDEITATSFDARELAIATRENIEVR